MSPIDHAGVAKACDFLYHNTISHEGCMHSGPRAFDACMRSFDCRIPADAVTFRVFLNAPVMALGEITIHRNGFFEVRRDH